MLNPYEGGRFKVTQIFKYGTHNGMDIVGLSSKKLIAMVDGTVHQSQIVTDKSNRTWEWGNYVTIKADTGELIVYAHLSKRLVSKGDRVKKGDVIGIEGNTGYSFGSHCHLEVRNANNRVTKTVNTPLYTDIPNVVQKVTIDEEEIDMTKAEVEKLIDEKIAASKERVYHTWNELPSWAVKPLRALYDKGYFKGSSASDLNISQTKLEVLVIMARVLEDTGFIEF